MRIERLAEDLHTVEVPNLEGFSGQATNVYIVGRNPATLIDTGSNDHGATVSAALDQLRITDVAQIILTHGHGDHAGSALALQQRFGPAVALHPRDFDLLSRLGDELKVDRLLADADFIEAGPYHFHVLETPGHSPGHVALYEPTLSALFAGDLISGNGTIAVVPPRGSMRDYLDSLRRVEPLDIDVIYPGHGPAIKEGKARIVEYIAHRERRSELIYDCVAEGLDTIETITDRLYPDVLPRIRPLAEGTVLSHLILLVELNRVRVVGGGAPAMDAQYAVV